jgi:hypothetical protein
MFDWIAWEAARCKDISVAGIEANRQGIPMAHYCEKIKSDRPRGSEP